MAQDEKRLMLRHTVATLAYRLSKTVRDAPSGFGESSIGATSRSPGEIMAHVGDVLEWALSMARDEHEWKPSAADSWDQAVTRTFTALEGFDAYLASEATLGLSAEQLFQGPIADALTHVGQIALMRRLSGSAVRGENYSKALIEVGRTGRDQVAPHGEFD